MIRYMTMFPSLRTCYETQEMKSFALISACGKLYKARLFEQLRFDMGKLGEDGYLNQKVYLLSEKVIYLNKGLYAYRIRKGSLSRVWTEKWMHALVDAMSERITLLANMGYPSRETLGSLSSDVGSQSRQRSS